MNGRYYLIATDLRIEKGEGWQAAQERGSRDIIIWESEDLVHWERSVPIQSASVRLAVSGRRRLCLTRKNRHFSLFASKVKCDGEETAKHRIYAAYTKDFVTFSDTFLYVERERDVIDTTILRSNGKYYRISKDETDSRLILEEADSLRGDFKRIACPVLKN